MTGFVGWMPGARTGSAAWVDARALLCVVALLSFGLVMVASASLEIAARNAHDPLHYVERQIAYALLGACAAVVVYFIAPQTVFRGGGWLVAVSLLLLIAVLLVGREVNGSRRWISLAGFAFQPSEFAKLALLIYLAGYVARRGDDVRETMSAFVRPLLIVAAIAALLLLQPDYGGAALISAVALALLWIAGVRLRYFFSFAAVFAALAVLFMVSSPYRWRRVVSFFDPWQDPFAGGYQLTQSLIAFGSGGFGGVGLGNGVQKLFYLPEAHTDFIFSVVAEELGFIAVCAVVAVFWLLVWRCFAIAARARRENLVACAYFCHGAGIWFGLQAFTNMAVAMGMLPTKGITLPFISAGGSSLVASLLCVGLLMRVHYEAQCRTPSPRARVAGGRRGR